MSQMLQMAQVFVSKSGSNIGCHVAQIFIDIHNIKMDKARAVERIDGAVALVMALDRAMRCGGAGNTSVYEDRGLLFL